MLYNTYRALPLQALYEILISSVRDLLAADETRQDNTQAFIAMKKQVVILLEIIEEKRREQFSEN